MDPCLKVTSSISEDLIEPPTLSWLSDVIFDNNQCKMNDSISKTEVNGCEVGKIHASISNHTTDDVKTIVTFPSSNKKIRPGHMKMLGRGVIASSNLFLLDFCQDLEDIDYWFQYWWLEQSLEFLGNMQIIGLSIGITTHQRQTSTTRVFGHKWWIMIKMAECLFDACRRFDSFHPEGKHKQELNLYMKQLCCIKSNSNGINKMSTNTHHHKNCNKKQPFNSPILPAKCTKRALPSFLMSPITWPHDHCPVKPPCPIKFNKTIEDSDSNIDDAECIISDAVMLIDDIKDRCILDKSCRPEFMEMDGTYDHKLKFHWHLLMVLNLKVYSILMNTMEKVQWLKPMHLIFQGPARGMCSCWWSQPRIDITFDISFQQIRLW